MEIPIPQLGGTPKVGEVSFAPQTLNTLYKEVAILDALRLEYCDGRLAAAQISLASFQAANERMLQQEEKIATLALSATHGEVQTQKALSAISNAPAPIPTDPAIKKADDKAVAAAKEKADETASPASASTSALTNAIPSAVAPALPPQVAAVVKNTPRTKLLKTARAKVPRETHPPTASAASSSGQ